MAHRHKLEQLRQKVEADPAFLKGLRADPDGVLLREVGMRASELEQLGGELSDEQLTHLSGGVQGADGDGGYRCSACGHKSNSGLDRKSVV